MKRLTEDERKDRLMSAIGETLKKQRGEVIPKPKQAKGGATLNFTEDDTVINLSSTTDNIEQLSEVLLSLLDARKGC